jgi:hypothetical protein
MRSKVSKRQVKSLAFQATQDRDSPTYLARFDTNSFQIGIDTLCRRKLFGNPKHFEAINLNEGFEIQGISGGLKIAGEGTFVFRIQADHGIVNTIKIPRSFYVPGLKMPLLSPQHWAKTANDNFPINYGTKIENDEDRCTLLWKQQTRRKRVHHDELTGTPIFRTAPGTTRYHAFEAIFMAASASSVHEHIKFDANKLCGPVPQDPAEFVAEENLLRAEIKTNEGVVEQNKGT